jgi:SAM-dependent methyltransferase
MKRYDRAYFEKWYRDPRHRVRGSADLSRRVHLAIAVAEYLLGRPVRSVLDVGCGEGVWQPVVRRLRPRAEYLGVDSSAYAVRRFGARRHIRFGRLATLPEHVDAGPFDLIVCSDVLNYLSAAELARGLRHVRNLLGGVAYLELYTHDDQIVGDLQGYARRTSAYYRRLFARLGLTPCGPHCYVAPSLADELPGHQRAP